jgi:hypothetical protein
MKVFQLGEIPGSQLSLAPGTGFFLHARASRVFHFSFYFSRFIQVQRGHHHFQREECWDQVIIGTQRDHRHAT